MKPAAHSLQTEGLEEVGEVYQPKGIKRMEWPEQSNAERFFGRIEVGGDGRPTARWESNFLTSIVPPYPMRFPPSWGGDVGGQPVRRIVCHKVVATSLLQILGAIWELYDRDIEKVRAARMDLFGGCYNFRPKRGGRTLSMHSYGIAIDLDPDNNEFGKKWKPDSGMMPEEVVDIFHAAGWTWGGLWKTGDAMHFQATQPL